MISLPWLVPYSREAFYAGAGEPGASCSRWSGLGDRFVYSGQGTSQCYPNYSFTLGVASGVW